MQFDTDKQYYILLAEDNDINRITIVQMLKKRGFKVFEVENGIELIDAYKENDFDLILLDIQMPKMDGFEAVKILKEEYNCSIPIVALTAHALLGFKEKCLEAKMNDYISKPVKFDELIEKIYENLKK